MDSNLKKKINNNYCCVPQCNSWGSRTPNISFHRFPHIKSVVRKTINGRPALINRRKEWKRILRIGKEVTNRMSVCSRHFDKDAYTFPPEKCRRPRLKPFALPTLFLPVISSYSNEKMTIKKKDSAKCLACYSKINRRADREPTNDSRLCSCHFKDGKKVNKPTIFSYCVKKKFDFPSPEKKVSKNTSSNMVICCVPLCNSHGGQRNNKDGKLITFHELPSDSERRELWLKAIKNQESFPIKFWDPIKKAKQSVICNLHFQPSDFVSGVKFRCLLPEAVPSIFPSYKNQKKIITKRKKTETEKRDVPVSKIPSEEHITEENSSNNHAENLVKDSSGVASEKTSALTKYSSPKKKNFGFSKLHKCLSSVQKPNQYWGVTPTDKFIIFSMWNDKYIPEKRVVIEHNLNVKVFLGDLEINTMNLMEFTGPDDVSNLLDKVDTINYSGKSIAMNDIN